MQFQSVFKAVLSGLIVFNSMTAFAANSSQIGDHPCAVSKELSMPERDSMMMFHAHLSHLLYNYGRPNFETALKTITEKHFPKEKFIQVSPYYYEKVLNLLDQARLRNSVALTIGLDHPAWEKFERPMKSITLMGGTGGDLANPMDKAAENLVKAIGASRPPKNSKITSEQWAQIRAEALARAVDMNTFMLRWKSLNGDIIQERAAASAKKLAVLGVGLVGAGVLCSTLVIAAPIVSGAGAAVAGMSSNPVVAALLIKMAETAAGSAIGFVGAPAAVVVTDSYKTLARASQQSANKQTEFSCELSKQIATWQAEAPQKLLSASLVGAGMGAAGGALTFSTRSAKLVLYATGLGVAVAQAYALGKMGETTIEALAFYRLADEAAAQGQIMQAREHLMHARELAVEAGEHGLEAVIVATLSYHVAGHFVHALQEGQAAIRQLYAASADTLPTAAKAAARLAGQGQTGALAEGSCEDGKNCDHEPLASR